MMVLVGIFLEIQSWPGQITFLYLESCPFLASHMTCVSNDIIQRRTAIF